MKPQSNHCRTCDKKITGTTALGDLCPACILQAVRTPVAEPFGTATIWTEAFPQLTVKQTLREDADFIVYLAELCGEEPPRQVILQVASGAAHERAGGAGPLQARVEAFASLSVDGLAPVLDFGDLGDAFFLVTEAPTLPTVPEALSGLAPDELAVVLRAASSESEAVLETARDASLALRFDPDISFLDPDTARLTLTPNLLTESSESDRLILEPTVLAEGSALGSFTLVERAGEGGFGEVWHARQKRPVPREVALKILKSGIHSQRARARFEVEQQALARLDHPHIARFFNGGTTTDGRPYFAMEWVNGQSITRFCQGCDAPLTERLRLFCQVADAVHHAHQKGIIHRDLKPSNVMVSTTCQPAAAKVIDFGIARAVEDPLVDRTQLTRAYEVIGTPIAMSPEQAAGAGGADLDARTDIYSLGVLLYELLSGRPPFDPALPPDELRRKISEEDPPRPSTLVEDTTRGRQLRGDLDWITMRCLEKEPSRRYVSASSLARDLERHLAHEPVEAGPPEWSYRVGKFVRRHRTSLAFTTALFLALLGGLIASTTMFVREKEARSATEVALETAKGKIYVADVTSARQNWEGGRIAHYWDLLQTHIPTKGDNDRRGWEWYYLRSLVEWHEGEIQLHGNDSCDVIAPSPDGRRLASGSASGQIAIYDLAEARTIAELEAHRGAVTSLSWDPLGGRFASAGRDGRILMWELDESDELEFSCAELEGAGDPDNRALVAFSQDGELLATGSQKDGKQQVTIRGTNESVVLSSWEMDNSAKGFSWSPDGDRLAVAHGHHQEKASVWEVDSGIMVTELTELVVPRKHSASIAWSPDGRHLAMVRNRLWVFDTETWDTAVHELTPGTFCAPNGLVWSPDSQQIAAIHEDRSIRVWDVDAKRETKRFHGSPKAEWKFTSLAWSPDADLLIASCSDGAARIWKAERREPDPIIPCFGSVTALGWSADGSRLAIANVNPPDRNSDGSGYVCSLFSPESGSVEQLDSPTFLRSLAWSPTQPHCATIDFRGSVTIWDSGTSDPLISFQTGSWEDEDRLHQVAWSSDGKRIATVNPGHEALIWEAATGEQVFILHGKINRIEWSPDGRFLLTGAANGALEMWTADGQPLSKLPAQKEGAEGIESMSWSPDSQHFAAANSDRATIWDVGRDGCSPVLALELPGVRYVDWHPAGERIAVVMGDGSIRIADSRSGDELLSLPGHGVGVKLAWSPDGRRLASTDYHDARVKVWDASRGIPKAPGQSWRPGQFSQGSGNLANRRDRIEKLREEYQLYIQTHVVIHNSIRRARSLRAAGRGDESIALLQAHLTPGRWSFAEDDSVMNSVRVRFELVKTLGHLERYEEALDASEECLEVVRNSEAAPCQALLPMSKSNRAYFLIMSGRFREALDAYSELITEMEQEPNLAPDSILEAKANQGRGHTHLSEFAKAAVLFEIVIAEWEQTNTTEEKLAWFVWDYLPICYSKMGRHEDALDLREKTIALRENALGVDHEQTLSAKYGLAVTLSQAGRDADAIEVLKELSDYMPENIESPSRPHVMGRLAAAYRTLGKTTDFERTVRERRKFLEGKLDTRYQELLGELGSNTTVLVPPNASWRWLDTASAPKLAGAEPLFTSFPQLGFDDTNWKMASDSILGGFAEEDFAGQWLEETHRAGHDVGHQPHASLFRTKFSTNEPFDHLELHLQHDDGVVVFLDGKEVARENVRLGPASASLQANICRNHAKEFEVSRLSLAISAPLEPGEHLLAISLHNHNCWFNDLRLAGVRLVGWNDPSPATQK